MKIRETRQINIGYTKNTAIDFHLININNYDYVYPCVNEKGTVILY